MTTLYNKPGSADGVIGLLEPDTEAQMLYTAQLAYFRGETDKAKSIATEIAEKTSRSDVILGCGFILCLTAMYSGDASSWIAAREMISKISCLSPEDEALRDFHLGNVDSALYDKGSFPEWFRNGDFSPLPPDYYPIARLIYLKWLMLSKGDPSVSMICGTLISQSRMEGALLSEIYCLLLTAIGFHDRGQFDKASELIDAAIAKALPDRLYAPFAEYRNELGVLLDERLVSADKTAAADIRRLYKRLIIGWAELCNKIRGKIYTTSLTTREHHAAKLAAKGLNNAEIASRMKLSVNTVKRYIGEAIAKTGVSDRSEFAAFIALDDDTLP